MTNIQAMTSLVLMKVIMLDAESPMKIAHFIYDIYIKIPKYACQRDVFII